MNDQPNGSNQVILLTRLRDHPANANVMPAATFRKLAAHIKRTHRYPPIVVRPLPNNDYQILDGHHRASALRELGHTHAHCVVWDADDQEALVLIATLNRLQGRDDPRRRASLIASLSNNIRLPALAELLPERLEQLQAILANRQPPPRARPPVPPDQIPVAVHFFLLPDQKRTLDQRLERLGGTREQALMRLVGSNKDNA